VGRGVTITCLRGCGAQYSIVLNLRTTTSQNCEAAPRRARIYGSQTFVPFNSRRENNEKERPVYEGLKLLDARPQPLLLEVRPRVPEFSQLPGFRGNSKALTRQAFRGDPPVFELTDFSQVGMLGLLYQAISPDGRQARQVVISGVITCPRGSEAPRRATAASPSRSLAPACTFRVWSLQVGLWGLVF